MELISILAGPQDFYQTAESIGPVSWEVNTDDFGDDKSIVQSKLLVGLPNRSLIQVAPDSVFLCSGNPMFACLLPPVFIDSVL